MDRQAYYRELVEYILKEFYQLQLNPSENYEALLPQVRIDLFFELPKYKIAKARKFSPFPYFGEQNLVHIKAFNDRLSKDHFIQYIGELYIKARSEG